VIDLLTNHMVDMTDDPDTTTSNNEWHQSTTRDAVAQTQNHNRTPIALSHLLAHSTQE